ncbi:glycosyltransferase [Butyrivibrio sp. VCD2006]|uniref:glycosyltransferase n=1 Tax=Butyrivibrio sp. VCD2006 TaxID=1280664 RepID=UPI0004234853|nr:glycosyltransferase family 2 protein [Butyrivibrio sp. VCD2006]
MKKVAIVLLNYNSSKDIIDMVDVQLKKIVLPPDTIIIIVDNNSTDNSLQVFEKWNKKCIIIESSVNGGYARGNNIGIKYAEQNGFDYVWILNSDVVIRNPKTLDMMLEVMSADNKIGAVSPIVYSGYGNEMNRNLYRPTIFDLTIGRIRYRRRGRRIDKSLMGINDNYCYNYKPQGCCMLLNVPIMHEVGYLDNNTFLFMEEPILGERLLNNNYRSALCLSTSIIHNHNSDYKSEGHRRKVFKWQLQSEMYYYREYRKFPCYVALFCELFTIIHHFVLIRFRYFK